MNLKKLSVKNFIGDLPRIINESLAAIEKAFADIYDEETNTIGNDTATISCKSVNARGNENGSGIVSYGDIQIVLDNETISLIDLYERVNNETISLIDLYERVKVLENANNQATYSKSMLAKKKLQ